ncbi:DUF4352 domain-containing protein [Candidatus Dojkabacteria bacterium]|uniref:DUF4352 domain-containing protein n=1 Tax=Candidatus Dojkabacteria bacterium TaxID=2099670 RepID=A0A955L681_9BACT|nr:DUF4352 domain-containing protein [Candidatus Dojkabacteria bacterium]
MEIKHKLKTAGVFLATAFALAACIPGSSHANELIELSDASAEIRDYTASATLHVNSVTLDFFPEEGEVIGDPSDDGNQFIRVEVTVENTGDEEFALFFSSFLLDTSAENGIGETFLINDSNSNDHLESTDLGSGESTTGALYFEVSADESLDTMKLLYEGYDENFEDVYGEVPFAQ